MEFGPFGTKWTVRIERCPYYRGVRKERFDCIRNISNKFCQVDKRSRKMTP